MKCREHVLNTDREQVRALISTSTKQIQLLYIDRALFYLSLSLSLSAFKGFSFFYFQQQKQ